MKKLTDAEKIELSSSLKSEDILMASRCRAILLLNQNIPLPDFIEISGYLLSSVRKLLNKFRKLGLDSLKSKIKVRELGRLLSVAQRTEITHILSTNKPSKLWQNAPDAWDIHYLARLILEFFEVKYRSKTSLYLIFKESKFSYRFGQTVNEKRNEKDVKVWAQDAPAIIEKERSDPNTVIFVADESILTSTTRIQKAWLPEGKSVFIEESTNRKMAHLYGFLNIESGQVFAFRKQAQTGEITVSVLKDLARIHKHKRIVIFWDNASWHKSKTVREFLGTTTQFKLYNFPPYAPDLNPIEKVWKELKSKVFANRLIKNFEEIIKEALNFLKDNTFNYKFF